MKLWYQHLAIILVAAVVLGGCSLGKAPRPEAGQPAGHGHAPAGKGLGLQPAVVDNMEMADVAVIKDGKLVETDLINTVVALHGLYAVPKEGTVLLTIDGRNVAWSNTGVDYPVIGTVPGPVTYTGDRLRMTAEQFGALMTIAFPNGSHAVKDGKLVITTGR